MAVETFLTHLRRSNKRHPLSRRHGIHPGLLALLHDFGDLVDVGADVQPQRMLSGRIGGHPEAPVGWLVEVTDLDVAVAVLVCLVVDVLGNAFHHAFSGPEPTGRFFPDCRRRQ